MSGSTEVSEDRVEAYLGQLLANAGIAGAYKLAAQLSQMTPADRVRLVREIQALSDSDTELMEVVGKVLQF